jgi:hypothetical protein
MLPVVAGWWEARRSLKEPGGGVGGVHRRERHILILQLQASPQAPSAPPTGARGPRRLRALRLPARRLRQAEKLRKGFQHERGFTRMARPERKRLSTQSSLHAAACTLPAWCLLPAATGYSYTVSFSAPTRCHRKHDQRQKLHEPHTTGDRLLHLATRHGAEEGGT